MKVVAYFEIRALEYERRVVETTDLRLKQAYGAIAADLRRKAATAARAWPLARPSETRIRTCTEGSGSFDPNQTHSDSFAWQACMRFRLSI
jgi:hypothetical protein